MDDLWLYLLAVLLAVIMLFWMVYFIVELTDLQDDYTNPIDLCAKLNKVNRSAFFH